MSKPIKVLLLDDSENDGELIARKLRDCATVKRFDNRESFETALVENGYDVALVDLTLVGWNGSEAIQIIQRMQPDLPIIVVTGSCSPEEADAACELGAVRFFIKDQLSGLDLAVKQTKEVRDLRQQAIKHQRLESIGDLAAGIVHDFNGLLQILTMCVDTLRIGVQVDSKIIKLMENSCKQGAELTAQILQYARGSNGSKFKSVTAEYLVTHVDDMIRRSFPSNIHIHCSVIPGTASVRCDTTQLMQVLMNLANNARDAMPNGGTLTIIAQNVTREPPCVRFSVQDTGFGIPDEIIGKLWEPFFTTKPHSKGTGLGLPIVKRIVEAHRGSIELETEQGKGTTFHVFIPIAVPWTSNVPMAIPRDQYGHGKTVLIVDDDMMIRELMQFFLETAGYQVITAPNGPDALEQFKAGKTIDAIILDLSMPLMNGDELIGLIRAQGHRQPAIMLTGYDTMQNVSIDVYSRLKKPVSREVLLMTLASALKTY